jgi:hypothetical protein
MLLAASRAAATHTYSTAIMHGYARRIQRIQQTRNSASCRGWLRAAKVAAVLTVPPPAVPSGCLTAAQ